MTGRARGPRLVMVVAGGATEEPRVRRTALAAARAGWDVTLLCTGEPGSERVETSIGRVRVIQLPTSTAYADHAREPWVRGRFIRLNTANQERLPGIKAAHQAWLRDTTARMGDLPAGPRSKALGAIVRGRRVLHRKRLELYRWEKDRAGRPVGDWRRDCPALVDLDLVLGPVIEELKPDLIHAGDVTMLPVTALSAGRMRARGEKVAWIYEPRGLDAGTLLARSACREVERRFIGQADGIVTASPQLAASLAKKYRLTSRVVRDAPVRALIGRSNPKPSVRPKCGLTDDVPLIVHWGPVASNGVLRTAISGLPELPDVHLAIVSDRSNAERKRLLALAEQLGVGGRVHVVKDVATHDLPDYLSSAGLGVIGKGEGAQLADYLHAGVPVVWGDQHGDVVREHDLGEVFGDGQALAAAVRAALARRDELAAHITEPLLTEFSWEHQAAGLTGLYRRVAPRAPEPDDEAPWLVGEDAKPPAIRTAGLSQAWRPLNPSSRVRLGLGVANYAGQMGAFAQAICHEFPDVSAEVTMRQHPFASYPADFYLDVYRQRDLSVQLARQQRILQHYTHLIVDAFMPVFGFLNGSTIAADLPTLKWNRLKVALLAHGTEIRNPAAHLARYENSLFRDAPEGTIPKCAEAAERNKRIAEESGLPLFVTTPDLLRELPEATWSPVVVDVDAWATDLPVMERARPQVLHAPSARWTKGTDRILPLLESMHDRGTIDLVLAENMTWDEIRAAVQSCDIVVDQFALGIYGAFAVEAMAAGRPVIGFWDEPLYESVGVQPPILNALPETLADVLDHLLEDPERAAKIGKESAAYARDVHDGRRTAQVFRSFLGI